MAGSDRASHVRSSCFALLPLLGGFVASAAAAQHGAPCTSPLPRLLGAQVTAIGQRVQPFASRFSGPLSLPADGDRALSHSYGVYLGSCLTRRLDAYADLEMVRGGGIGHGAGLAGYTNGDVIRQGTVDLGQGPYIARAFVRYATPFGTGAPDTAERGMDQRPELVSPRRLEITAGRFAVSDLLDLNRYANSTRTQFLNWALFQNTAWDFAADTRGYNNGLAVAWITPRWAVRAGSFQMPTRANGNVFDADLRRARGDNIELALSPAGGATVVRILAYVNHARMGRYEAAVDRARRSGTLPDIVADDAPGRRKGGVGLNIEQPLADGGETGAFLRAGWSDGRTESFVFTEVDRHLSGGLQLAGRRWRRTADRAGLAAVAHALAPEHRHYLEAGGHGFMLGDGRLRYGREMIVEAYYRLQLGRYLQLSPDLQRIANPGYNRTRGPAWIPTLRVRAAY